ncbi:MAG: hypothetical protein IJ711_02315, partial [Lachnospiraceae bacterium]|nr:hypothetical protein [Lachnospiraceae bacterium]
PCCWACKNPCEYQCQRAAELRKGNEKEDDTNESASADCTEPVVQEEVMTEAADDYYNSIAFIREVLNEQHERLRNLKTYSKKQRRAIEETKVIIAALACMISELENIEMKEKLAELEKEEK